MNLVADNVPLLKRLGIGDALRLLVPAAALSLALGVAGCSPPAQKAAHIVAAEVSTPAPGSYADPPLQLDTTSAPSAWKPASFPHLVRYDASMGARSNVVSFWYRIRPAPMPEARDPYLYIPRWRALGAIAIYADGRLIYAPRSSKIWNGFNLPIWTPLGAPGQPAPKEILIHVNEIGGNNAAISSLWVGDKQALASRVAMRRLLQNDIPKFASEVLIVAGVVAVLIWLRRRNEPIYLLTFALAILNYLHGLQYWLGQEPLPISDGWFQWMEINSEIWWLAISFVLLVLYSDGGSVRTRWVVCLFAAVFTAGTLLARGDVHLLRAALLPLWLGSVLALVPMIVIAWRNYLQSRTFTGVLFAAFGVFTPLAVLHDVGMSRLLIGPENIYWVPWIGVFQASLILYASLHRYLSALGLAQKAEAELALRLAERERELSATHERLRIVQEREVLAAERQRLMRDMHDGVGSMLIGALSAVEGGRASAPDTALILRECIDDLKLTIDSLEPVESDLLLLLATVRYRLQPRFEKAGLALDWRIEELPPLPSLSPDHALHILRIAQEIFTNVLKHAQATTITVSVTAEADDIVIAFEDDGLGFQPRSEAAPAARGHGLKNLRSRALAIGGEIAWRSNPGHTRFELRLPIKREETAAAADQPSIGR